MIKNFYLKTFDYNLFLQEQSRLPNFVFDSKSSISFKLATLLLIGIITGICSSQIKLSLGIPGHSIIKIIIPLSFGIALVPLKSAGSIMGLAGVFTVFFSELLFGKNGTGTGGYTSLVFAGFFLDLTLSYANNGWKLYSGLMISGLLSNLIALCVRSGFKSFSKINMIDFNTWFEIAAITYPVCGLIAGFISALLVFKFKKSNKLLDN